NGDENPMASRGAGEAFRRRKYQVRKAVHLLTMNLSARITRGRLALDLDFITTLPREKVETGKSQIIHELDIPVLLHEMCGNADLVGKGSCAMRAINGITQSAFKCGLRIRL